LLDFAGKNNGKANAEDLKKFIADRMQGAPSSTCPKHNVVLTYANPQAEIGIMWVTEPSVSDNENWEACDLIIWSPSRDVTKKLFAHRRNDRLATSLNVGLGFWEIIL
jgi:hypothetical protein